jgi:hypothetical protein
VKKLLEKDPPFIGIIIVFLEALSLLIKVIIERLHGHG